MGDSSEKADKVEGWQLQWEYHRMKTRETNLLPIQDLDHLGELGWELVTVFKQHADLNFIFKRPKGVQP